MGWILLGAALGFITGGAIGTVVAPQRGGELVAQVSTRLRQARDAAQRAADAAGEETKQRFEQSRRGRGRSRNRNRNRRRRRQ